MLISWLVSKAPAKMYDRWRPVFSITMRAANRLLLFRDPVDTSKGLVSFSFKDVD